MTSAAPARLAAIVLAGGTGRRLGGVDKAELRLGGRRMLDRVLDACLACGASGSVVVGAVEVPAGVHTVVEDPPRSGPAAGIVAGLSVLPPSEHVLLLACDLADPAPGVAALVAALPLPDGVDGVCVDGGCVDGGGRPQWLFGVYRRAALDAAAAAFGPATGRSVGALMSSLRLATLPADAGVASDDIDTWDAHAAWQQRLG